MKNQTLNKAKELKKEINLVKDFLLVFKEEANRKTVGGFQFINGSIEIQTEKRIKILGSRHINIAFGSHRIEIEIPMSMVDPLERFFTERLNELEKRFEAL